MLGFNLEHRHRYTTIPPSDLDTSVGSIWPTTRGFTDSGFSFNELWWDQQFRDDRISFRVGTINQKHFYDLYRFKSQKRYFLSGPLSDSPTIDFPRNGFGGVLRVSPSEELHVIAGIGDVNGERRVGSIDTFFSDREYFTALDFSFTPTFDTLGEGRYSVTFWHTDASASQGTPSGDGFAALVEQEVGEGVIPFARYGYGDGANLPIRHLVALGVGVEAPFGQRDDVAGLGGSWSRPRDGSLRDQWGLEAFYRVQLTAVFQVTPGVQLIANPSLRPGTDFLTILQLRVGLVF
jgi:porin